jgi:hypothetical protein
MLQHWPAVEALAAVLIRAGRIEGEHVEAMF